MRLTSLAMRCLPPFLRVRVWSEFERVMRSCYHYADDGLLTIHDHSFLADPAFGEAYERGVQASDGVDPRRGWRVHVALWAAHTALRAAGDFVECGVNAGFISSAIMRRLGWAGLDRKFYLVDTFAGPPLEQLSPAEIAAGYLAKARQAMDAGAYVTDMDRLRANFAEWRNAILVQGTVPQVLDRVPAERVAFLHLDMNSSAPECAALEHFWPRLSRGGLVLFDDYAHTGCTEQKNALDRTARALGIEILALPTGQGLLVV